MSFEISFIPIYDQDIELKSLEIPSPKSGTHYTITKLLWSRDLGGFTFLSVFERGHMTKIVINDRNYDRIITSIIMFREICVN